MNIKKEIDKNEMTKGETDWDKTKYIKVLSGRNHMEKVAKNRHYCI